MLVTKQDFHFRSSIYWEEMVFTISGVHPEKTNKRSLIVLAMITYFIISTTTAIYFYEFDRVVESSMLTVAVMRFLFKLMIFVYHKRYFQDIVEALEDPVFYSFSLTDLEHFQNESRKTRTLGLLHFLSAITYFIYLAVSPFTSDKDFQVVLIWKPLDMGFITFFCHLVALCFAICNLVSMDNVFRMMTTFACCQFDFIMNRLKTLDFKRKNESDVILRGNIIRHIHILRFVTKINNFVSYTALVQYLISIMSICFALFQTMKNSSNGIGNIAFLLCMIIEILSYCWYGEAIKDKNEDLSRTLYLSNWEESGEEVRRVILIIGERCKRHIRLDVGGFTSMSLDSFINIMKSAYSYFTVLAQICK